MGKRAGASLYLGARLARTDRPWRRPSRQPMIVAVAEPHDHHRHYAPCLRPSSWATLRQKRHEGAADIVDVAPQQGAGLADSAGLAQAQQLRMLLLGSRAAIRIG